jgi:hypothetical protein
MLLRKLLGLFAITLVGVLVEMVYIHLSRTGYSPSVRLQFKPNIDLLQ